MFGTAIVGFAYLIGLRVVVFQHPIEDWLLLLESGKVDEGESESLLTKVGQLDGVTATLISTISDHKGKVEEMIDGFVLAVVD